MHRITIAIHLHKIYIYTFQLIVRLLFECRFSYTFFSLSVEPNVYNIVYSIHIQQQSHSQDHQFSIASIHLLLKYSSIVLF